VIDMIMEEADGTGRRSRIKLAQGKSTYKGRQDRYEKDPQLDRSSSSSHGFDCSIRTERRSGKPKHPGRQQHGPGFGCNRHHGSGQAYGFHR
jgi:hypothetical protein